MFSFVSGIDFGLFGFDLCCVIVLFVSIYFYLVFVDLLFYL